MNLTPKMIKLIYCYLACLFLVICLVFNLTDLVDKAVKIVRFEELYRIDHSLTSREFFKQEHLKNINREEAEKLRQEQIAESKDESLRYYKNDLYKGVIRVILISIFLLTHIFIIRRTKET